MTAGVIEPRIAKILDEVNSYAEFSPSGGGVHIWTKGYQVPTTDGKEGRKVGNAEMYSGKHYLTVTGKHIPGTPLTIESRDLSTIYARICSCEFVPDGEKEQSTATKAKTKTEFAAGDPPQYQVVHDGSTNKYTSKTELLLTGTLETVPGGLTFRDNFGNYIDPPYPSQNEADQSLVNLLALRHKGDADLIDEDFRTSALNRDKWDRQDYRDATIQRELISTADMQRKSKRGRRNAVLFSIGQPLSESILGKNISIMSWAPYPDSGTVYVHTETSRSLVHLRAAVRALSFTRCLISNGGRKMCSDTQRLD